MTIVTKFSPKPKPVKPPFPTNSGKKSSFGKIQPVNSSLVPQIGFPKLKKFPPGKFFLPS